MRTTKKDRCCWNIRVSKEVIEKGLQNKCTREALHLQAASTINQVGYNKPVWSFLDGSIQSRKTESPGSLIHNGNSLLLRLWMFVRRAFKWVCVLQSEKERQKEEQRTKGEKERGRERRERREAALYLLSLFTGEVRGMEGDNLDTLVLGAPQPAILLLCPPALRPPGTPSEEGWTTPISLCSTTPKHFHKASEHNVHGLLQFYNVLLWITTVCLSDLKQRLCQFSGLHFL